MSREPAPPASFRPQGLVALSAVWSLRNRAGFVSHRRRSWDLPFGDFSSREVSGCFQPDGPTYRFPSPFSRHRSTGPADEAPVSGLRPVSRVPCNVTCDEHAGCRILPWIFSLPGLRSESLVQDFARTPLARLAGSFPKGHLSEERQPPSNQAGLRLRVSIDSHLFRSPPAVKKVNEQNHPPRVPCQYVPSHSSDFASGLCVHLTPRRTLLPTAGDL